MFLCTLSTIDRKARSRQLSTRSHRHDLRERLHRLLSMCLADVSRRAGLILTLIRLCYLPPMKWLANGAPHGALAVSRCPAKRQGLTSWCLAWLTALTTVCTVESFASLAGPFPGVVHTNVIVPSEPWSIHVVKFARAEKLAIHPYTIRIDDLPKNCPSSDALHAVLFRELRVEGVFSDFPDVTATWVKQTSK